MAIYGGCQQLPIQQNTSFKKQNTSREPPALPAGGGGLDRTEQETKEKRARVLLVKERASGEGEAERASDESFC